MADHPYSQGKNGKVEENGTSKHGAPKETTVSDHEKRVRGSEVFVGGLQRNTTEEILSELFAKCGDIMEVRIMKDHLGVSKGYGFVRFSSREAALKAQKDKNGTLLQGKKIGVTPSADQDTLFLGNLRKEWGPEEVDTMVRQVFQDVQSVELAMPPSTGESPSNKKRQNRGFAFVHFSSHAAAARAYRVANRADFLLGGRWRPAVDWAENEPDIDPDEMAKVKTAFVGNLPSNVMEDFLQAIFEPFGKIERVAISRKSNTPVGFVHFLNRTDLEVAMKELDGRLIDGPDHGPKFKIQVSLAKPADKNRKRGREETQNVTLGTSVPPVKFSASLGAYGPLGGAYGDYTDYVVAKNPRVASKPFALPEMDPYELAIGTLPPLVVDRLLRLFRQGVASRQELDVRVLENLRDLPEFASSSFTEVRSKGAYLSGVINRVRRELRDKPVLHEIPGRAGVRPTEYGQVATTRASARDSWLLGQQGIGAVSASRLSALDTLSVPYAIGDTDYLGYDSYGVVGAMPSLSAGLLSDPLLPRIPTLLTEPYALPSYRLSSVSTVGSVASGLGFQDGGASDRRAFKFDPFTGEPFKFDPFTGESLQPTSLSSMRLGAKYY